MRKSDFLAAVRSAARAAADEAFAGTENTAQGCPWLEASLWFYEGRSAERVERDLMVHYVPEAAGAASARDYVPFIAARVRRSVETWVETGKVTGLPEGLPGRGLAGSLAAGLAGVFFKAKPGGPRGSAHPRAVEAQLGKGRLLAGSVRSRMESAVGESFSSVRVHDDSGAARMSNRLRAEAFTVGEHIAFASGRYRPGTLIGDALMAHELAHTVQQKDADHLTTTTNPALETDATLTAARVVASLRSPAGRSTTRAKSNPGPRLRSGLRLQRCSSEDAKEAEESAKQAEARFSSAPHDEPTPSAGEREVDRADAKDAGEAATKAAGIEKDKVAEKNCDSKADPKKIVREHKVEPSILENPADTVKVTVKFACKVRSWDSIIETKDGTSLGLRQPTSPAEPKNEFKREWDGKRLFEKEGTLKIDDGEYQHRLDRVKYAFKYDKTTKKSSDLFAAEDPKLISPSIHVKFREREGTGSHHPHFTKENVDYVGKAVQTEMGAEVKKAKEAVAWAIRNQMVRVGTDKAETAGATFRVRSHKSATEESLKIADDILKKPMSEDITQGAHKWFSPNAQPKKGEVCKGEGCGGGLDSFTDTQGRKEEVWTPGFHKNMTYVPIEGIHEWRVRFYKL
jgi:hypothetical protein